MPRNHAILALTLASLVLGAGAAPAQRGGWGIVGHSSKVRVPDDLGREPIEVARTALSGGDVDRALSRYQDILDRLADKLAAVHRAPRTGNETDHILAGDRFRGLKDYVEGAIREIPEGVARYRELEGPRAAADLTRALAARDEELLRRIAIRWGLTEAGPLALASLGDILFQTGRVVEARLCADRLMALNDPTLKPELKARAVLRAASAHAAMQERDELRALTAALVNGDASVPVTWGGVTRSLSAVVEELMAGLDKLPPAQPVEKTLASFSKPAWQSQPFSRHSSEDWGQDEYFRMGTQFVPLQYSYFPVIPAVSDSAVYYCDGLKVEGLSLMTGAPLWPAVEAPLHPLMFQGYRHWNVLHEVVLDRGVVYACLEDQPDIKSDHNHMIAGFKPIETIAVRKLYAIDATTGEVKWTHASPEMARDAEERAFFDRISINTPPLVLGDKLYVGASYYLGGFRQWLCAFDRLTGRIVWKTYVGQGQAELNMFGRPVKEVVPGYVGEMDGVLVYSTNIGVVAAVDAITGVPKWVSAYEQELVPSSDGQRTVTRAPGWTVRRPLFYAGRAIIAPSDSLQIYVYDMDTGEGRNIPGLKRTRENALRHVIGIHDDALIVAGKKVHAFDLRPIANGDDPRAKWEAPPDGALSGDATIDGRPAVAGDRLFYTGRASTIQGTRPRPPYVASIDVRSGRILEEKQIEGSLYRGNVVFSPDAVVVAGDLVTTMFDVKDVGRRLEAAIEKSPDDPELRLRLARIELQNRNLDEAIAALERARALAASGGPRGEHVHQAATLGLYNLVLDLADDPVESAGLPSTPKERFEKALSYATTTRQQIQVLIREILWARREGQAALIRDLAARLLNEYPDERVRVDIAAATAIPEIARGAEVRAALFGALAAAGSLTDAEQYEDAIAMYQEALTRFPDEGVQGPAGTISIWRHAYLKIGEIVREKGATVYAAQERAAEALLEDGRKSGNLDALRTLLDRYPNSRHVDEAWIELSRRLREAGKDRDALRAVQRQLARYGTVTAPLLSELARSLEGAGAHESARDVLLTLKDRFGRESVAADGGTIEVAKYVDERLAGDRYRDLVAPPPIPEGAIGLQPAWTESPTTSGDEVVLVEPDGRRPKAADDLVLIHRDGELRALALETGRPKWSRPARSLGEPVRPLWQDGRLLVMIDGDLVALDPASGKEHWRSTTMPARALAVHAAHGKAYVMLRPPLGSRTIQLRALDVVTGEKLRDLEFGLTPSMSGEQPYPPSFGSSPQWLLCRLDPGMGAAVVIDGITGDPVFSQATGSASTVPPMLTSNNLLVTQTQSQPSGMREIRLVARNPKTQQVVWNFRLEKVNDVLRSVALTPELGVFSVRFGGTTQARREIIALDLPTGTTRMSIGLRTSDVASDGVIAGDILLVKFGMPDGKRFIRAYDLRKSTLLWDSVPYTGNGLTLSIHATRNYAVVRVSSKERDTDKRTDMIHFFETRTGLLKDSITLENTLYRNDQADVDLRDRAIVLRGGAEVSVRK
jgi:outer membrane protein assembly factor BamB/tetratricopeptide (TPR) repeat protein